MNGNHTRGSHLHPMEGIVCYPCCCLTWGHHWLGKRVQFNCDNMSIVHAWTGRRSKQPHIMVLLCHLLLVAANNNFTVSLKHVPGIKNPHSRCHISEAIHSSIFSCSTGQPKSNSYPWHTERHLNAQLRDTSLAGSTRAVYHVGVKHFISFCSKRHICPFPAGEQTLVYFAVSLSRSLAPSTISVYINAVGAINMALLIQPTTISSSTRYS